MGPAEVSPPAEVSSVEFISLLNFNLFVIIFQSGVHIEVLLRKFGWTGPQSLSKTFQHSKLIKFIQEYDVVHSVVANIELKFVKKIVNR